METKTLTGVKAEGDAGYVEAIFSRFNVIDHDMDVTLPGAFTEGAPVRISSYNHQSWKGALPVGRGSIKSDAEVATMEGQFFMNTTHGRDHFETVKAMADLGEWSYGYDVINGEPGTFEEKKVTFLRELKVHEVSPVLLGAGIGTQTIAAKSLKDMDDDEIAERAKEACKALIARGISLPADLVDAVRKSDAQTAETTRRQGSLALIAAAHGIDTGGS